MDKKQVKRIEIVEVKVNRLNCTQDYSGEYSTDCNVDFILSIPVTFMVFDKAHTIDRIRMVTVWDELNLYYASSDFHSYCFPISKTLIHKVYDRVRLEQKDGGCLKGWYFDDDIFEMLRGEKGTSSLW